MNTADMHEILKHLLDQHRDPDPSAYSPIPKFIRDMGAALSRIEAYEAQIPAVQAEIAAAEAEMHALEEKYPFLLNRAPTFQEKVGTLKNGEPFMVTKRNYLNDMRPRPWHMDEETYVEIRTQYFGTMIVRQQAINRLQQYRTWIEAAYQQWHENAYDNQPIG